MVAYRHHGFLKVYLACSANLPEGLFADVFSLFLLMVNFLTPVAQQLMEQSSPKFQDW